MDLDGLIKGLDRTIAEAKTIVEEEMEVIALAAQLTITQRITETGKDSEGNPFEGYTEAYQRRKENPPASAGAKNRYRGFVDFQFSGQMFNSIGIVERRDEGGQFVVTLAGRDAHTQDKMDGNNTKRTNWFSLQKSEIKILVAESKERITEKFQQLIDG